MAKASGAAVPVTDSLVEARQLMAAGNKVILVVAPAQTRAAAALMAAAPGRLWLMVGEPGDPASWPAANEMAAELGTPGSQGPGRPPGR